MTTTILGYSQTFQFPFDAGDFGGSLSAASLTLKAGGSGTVTLTVASTGGLTGDVTLSCTGMPALYCSFNPESLQLAPGGAQTAGDGHGHDYGVRR